MPIHTLDLHHGQVHQNTDLQGCTKVGSGCDGHNVVLPGSAHTSNAALTRCIPETGPCKTRHHTCDAALQQAAHDSVHSCIGVRGDCDPAPPQGSMPAALPKEEGDGCHQQHALAGAKGPVHHTQRACALHSTFPHFRDPTSPAYDRISTLDCKRPQLPVSKGLDGCILCCPKPEQETSISWQCAHRSCFGSCRVARGAGISPVKPLERPSPPWPEAPQPALHSVQNAVRCCQHLCCLMALHSGWRRPQSSAWLPLSCCGHPGQPARGLHTGRCTYEKV